MPCPPRFTIRAASALTGINQNTLRAWERRYGLIRPQRSPKGYRLYSNEDIERLRMIRRTMQEGIPVGRVGGRLEILATADPAMEDATLAAFVEQIRQAAQRSDRYALGCTFAHAVGLYSVRQAFHQALIPALRGGGLGQPDGDAERLLADFARERLRGVLAGLRPLHQQPRVLFACAPGMASEIPLMLLSLEVGLDGVSARYLGPDVTMDAVPRAAASPGLRAVAFSTSRELPREAVLELRDRLAGLPGRPGLLVQGALAPAERGWIGASGIVTLAAEPEDAARQVLRYVGEA